MKTQASRSQHEFATVEGPKVQRSQFNLSHGYKTTMDSGYLVPFFVDIAYPGDTFNLKANIFARLATPIVPFMDNLYLDTFFMAVPFRLVWSNFQKFMGEQTDPGDSTSYTIPTCTSPTGGYAVGSLQDYMGLQTVGQVDPAHQITVNNLQFRAYNLCFNQWFRDENMQDSVVVPMDDGPDTYTDYVLLKRGKRKDYFTGALPFPQKGPAVSLPLGTKAPISGFGKLGANYTSTGVTVQAADGTSEVYPFAEGIDATVNPQGIFYVRGTAATAAFPDVYADLTQATAATINQFRQAIQLQGWYERDARSGTRYTEIIQGHFGVVSPDARLQRPEYLGGMSTPIKINPVSQTSGTPSSGTPQGNLAAYGVVGTPSHGFVKSFTEHTIVIGLASIRADLSYQQGVNRIWLDQTRQDMYWPAFANLGEQTVLQQEIYQTGITADDQTVFGYQERYGHLKYKQSLITGLMKSTATDSLDVWHLAQKFTGAPTLSDSFISENPPIARVVAVTDEPQFVFDSWMDFKAIRPMPMYGTPATLSKF